MKFDLDEDQRAIAETVDDLMSRKFPLTEVRHVVDADADRDRVLEEFRTALSDLGVFGMVVPEEFGGAGLELLDVAVVVERLGYAAAPGPLLGPIVGALALRRCDASPLREKWLTAIADGDTRVAVAYAPRIGWDGEAFAVRSDAAEECTVSVLGGEHRIELLLVATPDGIIIVEDIASSDSAQPLDGLDPTRMVSAINLAGRHGQLLSGDPGLITAVPNAARVLLAADAYGGSSRCVDLAVEYVKTREQFGVPIGSFQAIKHQLADMDMATEPAQGLYWYAAHVFDREPAEAVKYAALVKAHITERYVEVARRLIEVYGGIGFTWECDAHLFLKRAVLDRLHFGLPRTLRGIVAQELGWR